MTLNGVFHLPTWLRGMGHALFMPAGFYCLCEPDAPPPGYAPQIRPRTRVQR